MKKALTRSTLKTWYFVNGEKVNGAPLSLCGDVSGLRGDVSGLSGNVDDCALSSADRENDINIADLTESV